MSYAKTSKQGVADPAEDALFTSFECASYEL